MDVTHDWELSKENIQPRREGRKFEVLNAVLSEDEKSRLALQKELQQKAFENELLAYSGADPLDVWVRYITWYEENFPEGKRGLKAIIIRCLEKLRATHQYVNDPRLLRVWVKYTESSNISTVELWNQLYGRKYFHKLAEFYVHWARALEDAGSMKDALATFQLAHQNDAEPKQILEAAQKSQEDRLACSLAKSYLNEPEEATPAEEKRVPIAEMGTHGFTGRAPLIRGGAPLGHVKVGPAVSNAKKENLVIPVFQDENQPQDIVSSIKTEEASLPAVKGATKENTQHAGKWTKPADPHPNEHPVVAVPTVPPATFKIYEDESTVSFTKPLSSAKKAAAVLRDKPAASSQLAPEALLQPGNKTTEKFMCNLQAVYDGSAEYSFEQLRARCYETKLSVNAAAEPPTETETLKKAAPCVVENVPKLSQVVRTKFMCIVTTPEQSFEELRAAAYMKRVLNKEAAARREETAMAPKASDSQVPGSVELSFEELRFQYYQSQGRIPSVSETNIPILTNAPANISASKETVEVPETKSKDVEVQTDIAGLDLILHFTRPESRASMTNSPMEMAFKSNENALQFVQSASNQASCQVWDAQGVEVPPKQVEPFAPLLSVPQQQTRQFSVLSSDVEPHDDHLPSPTAHSKAANSLFRDWLTLPVMPKKMLPKTTVAQPGDTFEIYNDPVASDVKGMPRTTEPCPNAPQQQTRQIALFPLDVEQEDDHLPSPTAHSKAAKSLFRDWLTQPVIPKKLAPKTNVTEPGDAFEVYKDPAAPEIMGILQKTGESGARKRLPLSDMAPPKPGAEEPEEKCHPSVTSEPFAIYVDPLPDQGRAEEKKQINGTKRVPLAVIASSDPEPEAQLKDPDVEMDEAPVPAPRALPLVNMDKWDEYMNSDNDEPYVDENAPPIGLKAPISKRQTSGVLVPSVDIPFDPEARCEAAMEPGSDADAPKPTKFLLNESTTQIISWQDNPFRDDFTVPSQAAFAAFARSTSTPFQQTTCGLGRGAVVEEDITCNIIMKPREAATTSETKTCVTEFKTPGANDAAAAARWTTKLLSPINEISREYYSSSSGSSGSCGANSTSRFHKTCPRMELFKVFPADYNPFDEAVRSENLSSVKDTIFSRSGLVQTHGNEPPLRESSFARLGNFQYLVSQLTGQTRSWRMYSATEVQLGGEECRVLLKLQSSSAGLWEFYIHDELQRRLQANRLDFSRERIVRIQKTFLYNTSSISVLESVPQRSLAQVISAYKTSGKCMPESLVFFYAVEMLRTVKELHDCKILHCEIKPDNFVMCGEPSLMYDNFCAEEIFTGKRPSVKIHDFGRSIDMALYPDGTNFSYRLAPQNSCCEMIEEKPWSYQLDYYGLVCTICSMLTGEVCQAQQLRNEWCIPNLERVQATVWRQLTSALLNCPVHADGHVTARLDSWLEKLKREFFLCVKERDFRSAVTELKCLL